jgi:hypothetical protein
MNTNIATGPTGRPKLVAGEQVKAYGEALSECEHCGEAYGEAQISCGRTSEGLPGGLE